MCRLCKEEKFAAVAVLVVAVGFRHGYRRSEKWWNASWSKLLLFFLFLVLLEGKEGFYWFCHCG